MATLRTWHYRLAELPQVAAELSEALAPHAVVALQGELGAGKTTLVQALCRAWGVSDAVTSPTFALVHEYATAHGPLHHVDAYRLTSPDEALTIGLDELLDGAHPDSKCLIEWPERVAPLLPPDTVLLVLTSPEASASADSRLLTLHSAYF